MKNGWHTLRSETSVTVARRLPPRFDVEARAPFPPARKGRLAHLVRQDLWRALQSVRGFAPVVEIAEDVENGAAMIIRAGGQVAGRAPASVAARIAAVIEDDANRRRWLRDAAPKPPSLTLPHEGGGDASGADFAPSPLVGEGRDGGVA